MDCLSETLNSRLCLPSWYGGMYHGPGAPVSLPNCDLSELIRPSDSARKAYELYTHLPELSKMWGVRCWPHWSNEEIIRPALQGLELNFRMISCVSCDARPHVNKVEWLRRLENLAKSQLEVISLLCEGDLQAPVTKFSESAGTLGGLKFWGQQLIGGSTQESLVLRLACCGKPQEVVASIHLAIECAMLRTPFTLGLGEPNLSGKPVLQYDKICKPAELFECRQSIKDHPDDHMLSTAQQISECWLFITQGLIKRVEPLVLSGGAGNLEEAAKVSWVVERVWKIISSTMDFLMMVDPDDFMKLKHELAIQSNFRTSTDRQDLASVFYCLRSSMLKDATKACKELRHLVPKIVGVEADPKGGPRLQDAVMELFQTHTLNPSQKVRSNQSNAIHLLQAFQAVEKSIREFYFSYQQLIISVMGSGELRGSFQSQMSVSDALSQIFSEPPYFPSVDGAKTFLGDYWHYHHTAKEGSTVQELAQKASKSSSLCSSISSDCDDLSSGAGLSEGSMA